MKFFKLIIFIPIMFFSCSNQDSDSINNKTISSTKDYSTTVNSTKSQGISKDFTPWANELISTYIAQHRDTLKEVNGYPIAYRKESSVRDGEPYIVVKIGHNYEKRFATNQWLYIHKKTKQVYEYDLPNDVLIPWSPNKIEL